MIHPDQADEIISKFMGYKLEQRLINGYARFRKLGLNQHEARKTYSHSLDAQVPVLQKLKDSKMETEVENVLLQIVRWYRIKRNEETVFERSAIALAMVIQELERNGRFND